MLCWHWSKVSEYILYIWLYIPTELEVETISYYLCGYMSSLQKNEWRRRTENKQFGAPCGKTATFI